jgi:hypothetical protein
MNEDREIQAEILKLARLLGTDVGRLSYLEQVAVEELRALREQATHVLFTAHETALKRLAAASRLLPVGLVASLSEHTFGPVLSARIAGLLEPARADQVGAKLSTPFLADVAAELDPRRASAVIGRIPPERIFDITGELACRREYVTMGRFVGHLGEEALSQAFSALDDEALIETVFVTEERLGPDRLARLLDRERVERLLALTREEDWPELRELVARSTDPV